MPKLLEQALDQMRTLHYCYRTEQPYLHWIKQFILYHGNRHPRSVPKTSATSLLTLQSSAPSRSFNLASTAAVKTARRYLAGQTM